MRRQQDFERRRDEFIMSAEGTGGIFADFDLALFWERSDYALKEYVGAPLTKEAIRCVERDLCYKLPTSYIELMAYQNGGMPRRTNHRINEPTSWSPDHIAISGIY